MEPITKKDDNSFFGDIVSKANLIMSTLKNELHLFQQLFVQLIEIEKPFGVVGKTQCNFHMFLSWFIKCLVLWAHKLTYNDFLVCICYHKFSTN